MNVTILTLYVQNVAKSRAFYTDIVKMPVIADQSSERFVMFSAGPGMLLALEDVTVVPSGQSKPAGSVEIGFEVSDVDAVYADWRAKGVKIIHEPKDQSFGREFLVADPDGHYLSVYKLAA